MPTFDGTVFLGKPTRVDTGTHNGARNKPNEDRYTVFTGPGDDKPPALFMIVADGVTSTHGGERASDIAVRIIQQALQAPATGNGRTAKSLRDRIAESIHRANQEILETARKDPELKGMSTTVVVAAVDGNQLIVMHLGDSRAYLIRNSRAYQLTRDHTWVQEALEEGRITPEQAANHPNKHVILRYLGDPRGISIDQSVLDPEAPPANGDETEVGGQKSRPGDTSLTLRPGDALLLCSDGLYNRILDSEVAAAVTSYPPDKAVKSLIDEAVKRQEPDNITIALWTTAGQVAPVAGRASLKPALLLAVAGALLALLAFVAFSFMNQAEPVPAATTVSAAPGTSAVAAAAPTDTPAVLATEASPAEDRTPTLEATAPLVTENETPVVAERVREPASAGLPLPTSTTTEETRREEASAETGIPPTSTAVSGSATPDTMETDANATGTPGDIQASATSLSFPDMTLTVAAQTQTPATVTATRGAVAAPSRPTSTPMPTSTAVASATPTATGTATRTPTPTGTSVESANSVMDDPKNSETIAGGPLTAKISRPGDNHSSNTATEFSWKPDKELVQGQEYEVVFWRPNQDSSEAQGLVSSSTATTVLQPVQKLAPDTYKWALWLVQREPYKRIRLLAGPYVFTVPSEGNDTPSDGNDDADSNTDTDEK